MSKGKDLLGSLSPIYGVMSGHGAFGKLAGTKAEDPSDVERQKAIDEASAKALSGSGMKTGGRVGSASKRADGCAQRGKTRGRMV
jgi:hypothetical protein